MLDLEICARRVLSYSCSGSGGLEARSLGAGFGGFAVLQPKGVGVEGFW